MTPEVGLPIGRGGNVPLRGVFAAQYPPGGPPQYGSPPPTPGYPGGQPGYPGGPYGAPPPTGGGSPYGGYPPPVQPPRKSNRGAILGIGGVLVIALAAVGGFFFVKGRGGADATATPAISATVANASAILGGIIGPKPGANVTPTPTAPNAPPARSSGGGILSNLSAAATARAIGNPGVATAAPSATPAPTVGAGTATPRGASATATRPAGTASPSGGAFATFTDPRGLVRLQYPNTWVASVDSSDSHNVLTLQSPDGTGFYLDIFDPQDGTIDQEIQLDRDFRTKSQNFTNTLAPVTDTKIGGEPAKTYTYSYVRKDTPNGPKFTGQDWEVNHGGKDFSFSTSPVGSHRAEIDAIIASVTYLK